MNRASAPSATLALLLMSAVASSQSASLVDLDLRNWMISNPAGSKVVQVVQTATSIRWQRIVKHVTAPDVTLSYAFRTVSGGAHHLWTGGSGGLTGSTNRFYWKLRDAQNAIVHFGYWSEQDLDKDCAQWRVDLAPASNYRLEVHAATSPEPTDFNEFRGAVFRSVRLPIMIPERVHYDRLALCPPTGRLVFESSSRFSSPMWLLYLSPTRLPRGIPLAIGDLWLAQPLLAVMTSQKRWWPGLANRCIPATLAYYAVVNGSYWQVLEFDLAAPGTTLRLGAWTRTSRSPRS